MTDYHKKHFPRIPRDNGALKEIVGIVASLTVFVAILTVMGWGVVNHKPQPVPTLIDKEMLKLHTERSINAQNQADREKYELRGAK